jgi:hypothetical protein
VELSECNCNNEPLYNPIWSLSSHRNRSFNLTLNNTHGHILYAESAPHHHFVHSFCSPSNTNQQLRLLQLGLGGLVGGGDVGEVLLELRDVETRRARGESGGVELELQHGILRAALIGRDSDHITSPRTHAPVSSTSAVSFLNASLVPASSRNANLAVSFFFASC